MQGKHEASHKNGNSRDTHAEKAAYLADHEFFQGLSLEELGEPCATLIKDFYIRKMNMDEISDKFGYTNSDNAKNQKYKCLQRLKRLYFDNFTILD